MSLRIYDPGSVVIKVGNFSITGFADGEFLNAARNEDSFSPHIGSGGEEARSKSNNKSGRITINLLATAPSNDDLATIAALDELSPSGDGVVPVFVKDNNGSELVKALKAWIVKAPDVVYDRGVGTRSWVLETGNLSITPGGNNEPTTPA